MPPLHNNNADKCAPDVLLDTRRGQRGGLAHTALSNALPLPAFTSPPLSHVPADSFSATRQLPSLRRLYSPPLDFPLPLRLSVIPIDIIPQPDIKAAPVGAGERLV